MRSKTRKFVTAWALSLGVGVSFAALAQTGKTLTSFDLFTYAAVMALSTAAGSRSAIKRFLDDDKAAHPIWRATYEVVTANCVGFGTFLLCEANNVSQLYTMGMVLINALAGIQSLALLTRKANGRS